MGVCSSGTPTADAVSAIEYEEQYRGSIYRDIYRRHSPRGINVSNALVSLLGGTIDVLVAEDDPDVAEVLCALLSEIGVYRPHHASTATDAHWHLTHNATCRVCLFDLGMNDFEQDELAVVRHHSHRVAFLVTTGSADRSAVFRAGRSGAAGFIEKPIPFPKLLPIINDQFLAGVLATPGVRAHNPLVQRAVEAALSFAPTRVDEWARHVRVSVRHLRSTWNDCLGIHPKLALLLYNAYATVLAQMGLPFTDWDIWKRRTVSASRLAKMASVLRRRRIPLLRIYGEMHKTTSYDLLP